MGVFPENSYYVHNGLQFSEIRGIGISFRIELKSWNIIFEKENQNEEI